MYGKQFKQFKHIKKVKLFSKNAKENSTKYPIIHAILQPSSGVYSDQNVYPLMLH